jgi:hypothetical protein
LLFSSEHFRDRQAQAGGHLRFFFGKVCTAKGRADIAGNKTGERKWLTKK